MLSKPGSCFIDAVDLAMGAPADVLGAYINHHFPEANCDQDGYHATFVNIALLELFKIGISQVDATPVGYNADGEPVPRDPNGKVVDRLTEWFGRPGFRCVVTGPATYGDNSEHANAWNGTHWFDPIHPETPIEEPTVDVRSLWVCTVPPATPNPSQQDSPAVDASEGEAGGQEIDQA